MGNNSDNSSDEDDVEEDDTEGEDDEGVCEKCDKNVVTTGTSDEGELEHRSEDKNGESEEDGGQGREYQQWKPQKDIGNGQTNQTFFSTT